MGEPIAENGGVAMETQHFPDSPNKPQFPSTITKAGETNAPEFETKIDHFDFFFFEDAAGTRPTDGMHGRVSGASKQLNTGIGEAFEALRLGTHYVYILANYPDEIE